MSKFSGLRTRDIEPVTTSKFSGLRTRPIVIQQGDSWPALIGKSTLKGAISTADLPANIANLGEIGLKTYLNDTGNLIRRAAGKEPVTYDKSNIFSSENVTRPSELINNTAKNIGIDLEPHPTTGAQRIASHAAEFGGSLVGFGGANLVNKGMGALAKEFGKGAVIGTGSGMLQEGGVDPLYADLASTFLVPSSVAAAKAPVNFLSKFTPKARKAGLEREVGDLFRESVGKKNLPTVLERLNAKGPLGTNLTTAELAENAGLAGLHRTFRGNNPPFAERNVANNMLMRKNLEELGNTAVIPEIAGENIRNRVNKNLQNAIEERSRVTDPLYKELNKLKTGVRLPQTTEFLKNESRYAKGDIKKALKDVEDLISSNQTSKKELAAFNKKYANLSPQARVQLEEQITGLPLPIELKNAVSDISGRIGAAKKSGNNEVARILSLAKENILADLAVIPQERVARTAYRELSKPITAIEKEPLLSRFVKKDLETKEFLTSPEKIPDLIFGGSLKNTKALMNQIGHDPKTLNVVRGQVANKILNTTTLLTAEGNLSYDKMSKLLRRDKEKLKLLFDENQIKVLEDVNELLRKRNLVETMGRAVGSNTSSDLTLLNSIFNTTGNKLFREAASSAVPGGGIVYEAVKEFYKNSRNAAKKDLIEKALLDPETAKLLLTKNIKDKETLVSMLERIYGRPLAASGMMAINREGQ
jgi:hypothetical protein